MVCTDTRREGCASAKKMKRAFEHLEDRLAEAKLDGEGGVLASRSRCLGVCAAGPIVAVYPDGVWYGACDRDGIDRIVDEHLERGRIVDDLVLGRRRP